VTNKIQGFYYVESQNHVYECRLRGLLKRNDRKENCVVGDIVEFSSEGTIDNIYLRKNLLERPLVANIDYIIIQFACKNPEIDYDKLNILLLNSFYYNITPVVVINKIDLITEEESKILKENLKFLENINIECFFISRNKNIGIEEIKTFLNGHISAFSGPSGVGKSSIINILQDTVKMETGEISIRLNRGKHTTKGTKLIKFGENGYIIETPGFSSIELPDIENKEKFASLFPEFTKIEKSCKFLNCRHVNEPGCIVKQMVEDGEIPPSRYEFYLKNYKKLCDTRWNKYEK
jgi:ribosome biogenesis GTPase